MRNTGGPGALSRRALLRRGMLIGLGGSGIAAINLFSALCAAAAILGFPSVRGCAISSARNSPSSRLGTCVRQPFSSCHPPCAPLTADTGIRAALSASRSR